MVEYRHGAHAVCDIRCHVIGVTRYRYKVMRGRIAERARDGIRRICAARDMLIVRDSVSPEHIHMLLSASSHLSPAKLVQYIKGRSSRRLQQEFPEFGKRYWGRHLWGRGYFCATAGTRDEAMIQACIESRKRQEEGEGFKIVAPTKP